MYVNVFKCGFEFFGLITQLESWEIARVDPVKDDSRELWVLLSPDVCDSRIIQCDSKNSLTRFLFSASSFFHLSFAVSQALLVTSRPLPGVLQLPLHVTSSRTITVPLVWLKSTPSSLHGPLRPPRPAGLEKRTNTQHWLFFSFCRVTMLRWRLEAHYLHSMQNPPRVSKIWGFYTCAKFCSRNFGAKQQNRIVQNTQQECISTPPHSPERLCLSFINTQALAPTVHIFIFSNLTAGYFLIPQILCRSHLSCYFQPQPSRRPRSMERSRPSTHTHTAAATGPESNTHYRAGKIVFLTTCGVCRMCSAFVREDKGRWHEIQSGWSQV